MHTLLRVLYIISFDTLLDIHYTLPEYTTHSLNTLHTPYIHYTLLNPPQPLVHSTMRLLLHWAWQDLTPPLSTAHLTAAAGGRCPQPLPADLDAPQCTPWTQVHALNTLKQVFQDKDLSAATSGYVALGATG